MWNLVCEFLVDWLCFFLVWFLLLLLWLWWWLWLWGFFFIVLNSVLILFLIILYFVVFGMLNRVIGLFSVFCVLFKVVRFLGDLGVYLKLMMLCVGVINFKESVFFLMVIFILLELCLWVLMWWWCLFLV